MSKIVFLKDKKKTYEGSFEQIGSNQVRLIFKDEKPTNKILLSGFNLINEYNGFAQTIREDYKYIYRTYEDNELIVELCNDNIQWVEPEPTPDPEPYEPTPEELEAQFQQDKKKKIELSKVMLAEYLENNPIHSTAHNNTEGVYSVTSEKQNLMTSQYVTWKIAKSINPNEKLTWNETGKSCEDWTEEEFLQLVLEIKAYVYPLVSYQQHIEENIYACPDQDELDQINIDYSSIVSK